MFGPLVVRDEGPVRTLLVGSPLVEQTAIVRGRPLQLVHEYTRLMLAPVEVTPSPRRVLVVGLGGGAIPSYLRATRPGLEVDVVEIDPLIVQVAERYFGFVSDERVRVHVVDALDFFASTEKQWDLVLLDAYAGDSVPEALASADFLRLVRSRLTPGGVLASNVWGPPAPQYERLLGAHRETFEHLVVLKGEREGNHILLGSPTRALRCAQLLEAARLEVGCEGGGLHPSEGSR